MLAICTLALGDSAHSNPGLALLVPVVILGLPILDTFLGIIRRLLTGRSPFAPDHDHIHHRLSRLGSRRQAVLILYGAAFWFAIAAFLITRVGLQFGMVIVGLTAFMIYAGIWLLGYMAVPELKTEGSVTTSARASKEALSVRRQGVRSTDSLGDESYVSYRYRTDEGVGSLLSERREPLEMES